MFSTVFYYELEAQNSTLHNVLECINGNAVNVVRNAYRRFCNRTIVYNLLEVPQKPARRVPVFDEYSKFLKSFFFFVTQNIIASGVSMQIFSWFLPVVFHLQRFEKGTLITIPLFLGKMRIHKKKKKFEEGGANKKI